MKQRAFRATLWSAAEVLLRQGLQFAVAIILARLLGPSAFGTVATLALFVGIATVLMDGGFSAALLQRQDIDHTDESTVFWFNLIIGSLVSLVLAVAAPAIAEFYGLPILGSLTPLLALSVFVASVGAIHATRINKRLDFRTLIRVNVVSTTLAGATGIALAFAGFGVWALAVQSLVMACVTTAMLWLVDAWRPAWVFSRMSARKLFAFGGYQLAATMLDTIYTRVYVVLLGRWFGVDDLGYYGNADNTRQMPSRLLASVLLRTAFPLFAQAAQDPHRLRRGLQLAIRGTMLLNVPLMLGGAVLAEPIVRVLFGEQWLPAAPVFGVLCLASALYPLQALNVHVLMAQGHSELVFRTGVAKAAAGILMIVAGSRFGLLGIAWSQVATSVLALLINTRCTHATLGYGLLAQVRECFPAACSAAAMASIVWLLHRSWLWPGHDGLRLAVLVVTGMGFYACCAVLLRLDAVRDMLLLLRRENATAVASRISS